MAEQNNLNLMDKIISLCKRRGFVYPASEIYGGFANAFDYGSLGAQLKLNLKNEWWKRFVVERDDIVGMDSSIIQNPKVWEASGHLGSFTDPLVECKKCHHRFRQDHVAELKSEIRNPKSETNSKTPNSKFLNFTPEQKEMLVCASGGEHDFAESKNFNLMFKTFIGVSEDTASTAYLRPETAQGMFINFQNVLQSNRIKVPFGIGQIGKAFRNEITPGNFTFRTREFEQAEIEYFVEPSLDESKKWFTYWLARWKEFFTDFGVKDENLTIRAHEKTELSHYSAGTSDIEYNFPFGMSELAGVAQRTKFDLEQHSKHSGIDLKYFDEVAGNKYLPFVVEPTMGVDRAMLAFLVDAYDESDGKDGREKGEVTLRLHPKLAPVKVAVFPLMKKEGMPEMAKEIIADLRKAGIATFYDESGSIGRRYRRQDEIGTPWGVTIDFDSIKDKSVTIRDRDTMKQERIKIAKLKNYFLDKLV
ncbi:MAG TPA: glycine--tRNA ligase [Patescibacteria group bacterium]|nr:glycine--tRNA ligase [Patescibacteria group bacterium]